jgi:hypothetical protein
MKPVAIYGFKCSKRDEKVLLKRVNDFLATHNRTTTKAKNQSMLGAYAPFALKHFYWNLNKEMGTWFDIYPNEDLNGKYFFQDYRQCGWLMHLRFDEHRHANIVKATAEAFVAALLAAIQFEHIIIKESDDLKAGLDRGAPVSAPNS